MREAESGALKEVEAVKGKISEHGGVGADGPNLVMNLMITGTDFGDRAFHMGAREGETLFEERPGLRWLAVQPVAKLP